MGPGARIAWVAVSYSRAMTLHQLGQADKARHWFEQATEDRRKEFDDTTRPPSWQLRVTLQRPGDEARQLIDRRRRTIDPLRPSVLASFF